MKTRKIFFIRHGKSDYTGVGTDLTDEGIWQVMDVARRLKSDFELRSSPTLRALSTAKLIGKLHAYEGRVTQVNDLRCTDFYTEEGAKLPWPMLPGEKSLTAAYIDHPRFDEGIHFEKRSEVRERFFIFLKEVFMAFYCDQLIKDLVVVSHYETLFWLVLSFGLEEPLGNAEIIELEMRQHRNTMPVIVTVTFRGHVRVVEILQTEDFIEKFFRS